MHRVRVIDSHTEGEPTRIVLSGGPDLGTGPLLARRDRFRRDFDSFRRALVNEPRGSEVMVGGLLVPPVDPSAVTGVIFFNNVGYLGMCGHGTIGLIASLAHAGRLSTGPHQIETPVGTVRAELHTDGAVSVRNVESRCYQKGVVLTVAGYGPVSGDVAWGGNWFFLVNEPPVQVIRENIGRLMDFTKAVQAALASAAWTGDDGGAIDHVEVSGPAEGPADSRNFVLCPGGMYDRSPCGTGTSAKLAALHARGRLRPGQIWRQQGILGGIFEGVVEGRRDGVVPTITGRAFVTAESELILDDRDPYRNGFPL
ncbi:MAG: proline racemase family protein [Thermoplasmata archaeon]|nr:proline racemase family protein [Thermoplasmata archaeon]